MSSSPVPWFEGFLGVAYRYYDLRMNVIPLFSDRGKASDLWNIVVRWWNDHDIKIRFVENEDHYWFIMASESRQPKGNLSFFKILPKSENYVRFKKGNQGEAYLRFGVYKEQGKDEVKADAVCGCGHMKEDHEGGCQIEGCRCEGFETFTITLLRKKKTISNIKFLKEDEVKDDSVSWNCLYVNKYKNS